MEAGRTACTICGIGFTTDDLVDVDGAPHCARCFALTRTVIRGSPDDTAEDAAAFTVESLEAMAAAGPEEPEVDAVRSSDGGAAEATEGEAGGLRERLVASVREWAAGRIWWVRAPILLWMAWILFHYWDAPWYSTLFHGIDLAIHEIGHILWAPAGEFMGFAGGTLTQLLAPMAAGVVLLRQRDWFGVSFAVCWLGINCFEIVEYAGDALTRQLPLVSPSTALPIHDWTYMLGELGILRHTDAVAAGWQWAGRVVMMAGIAFGAWVLYVMRQETRDQRPETRVQRSEFRGGR